MKYEDEKLFFEHDLAGPMTNLHGAAYLIKRAMGAPDEGTAEALGILEANLRTLERMLGWYWRIREAGRSVEPVKPWPVRALPAAVEDLVRGARLSIAPPSGDPGEGRATVPQEAFVLGLVGAALTLSAAAGAAPEWTFEEAGGVLLSRLTVPGDQEALDPGRLFRKPYWPSKSPHESWVDPGLPFLKAVMDRSGGRMDLAWSEGAWSLECALPLLP